MAQWLKGLLLVFTIISSADLALASALRIGASGGIGFGSAKDTGSYSEGPFGTEFFADYSTTSRFSIGGKHTRTWLASLGSSISSTMLSVKYYVNNDIPSGYSPDEEIRDSTFEKRSHAIFLGVSTGFAQASVRPSASGKSASAVGIAFGGMLGFDWQIFEYTGMRINTSVELSLIGAGTVSIIFIGGGFYLNF